VREPRLLDTERMVPVEFVTESTPELIRLRCTKGELVDMPPFVTTHYLSASPGFLPGIDGAGVMLWPYVGVQPGLGIDRENIAFEELAIHRGSHVHAADGRIGEVEEFVVNPANDGITHIVLREGHLWGCQDVTIPVAQIDRIDDDGVYLKLNKREIAALPALAVQRHSR